MQSLRLCLAAACLAALVVAARKFWSSSALLISSSLSAVPLQRSNRRMHPLATVSMARGTLILPSLVYRGSFSYRRFPVAGSNVSDCSCRFHARAHRLQRHEARSPPVGRGSRCQGIAGIRALQDRYEALGQDASRIRELQNHWSLSVRVNSSCSCFESFVTLMQLICMYSPQEPHSCSSDSQRARSAEHR